MPNAAIVAAALTDAHAHPYSLFLNGFDLIGGPGATWGVDLQTIRVDEQGPNGVSSIEFILDDPLAAITIPNGSVIRFQWNTPDVPLFLGWVDTYSFMPDFGGQGRSIHVQGIGEEALLDWLVVAGLPNGVGGTAPFPQAVSYLGYIAGVPNYQASATGSPTLSSQSVPISGWNRAVGDATVFGSFTLNTGVALNGSSLRRAIQDHFDMSVRLDPEPTFSGASQARVQFTMDFYGGLRMWNDYPGAIPSDYTNLTVNDAYAGPIVAENLQYVVDPSQVVHEVYVEGSTAAASGWFSDGSGIRGKQGYVSDTTNITTADKALQAAQGILQANVNQIRGSFELTDHTPVATIHTGSFVTITDTAVSLTAQQYRIMEIEKTFNGSGRQNWTVYFGSMSPNVVRSTRRLTYTIRGA